MDKCVQIFEILKGQGIAVYLPNQNTGTCKEPYCVVKDMGQYGDNNYVGNKIIEVLTYVPKSRYARMEELKTSIKTSLNSQGWLARTGQEQQILYIDSIEGYMSSIEYKISKKL